MTGVAVLGVGVCAPGLADWATAAPVLAGRSPWREGPMPSGASALLPPNERRRATPTVRLALRVGEAACRDAAMDPGRPAAVFASASADQGVVDRICRTLADDPRTVSPTLFHNSVHNAAAGYWGIATGGRKGCTTLGAYQASFAAGLLEAACQVHAGGAPVLLVAYDVPPPPPLRAVSPTAEPFGAALLLAPEDAPRRRWRLGLSLAAGAQGDALGDPALERLRVSNPAGRGLPLLACLARGQAASVGLEYLPGSVLAVDCRPAGGAS